MYTYDRTMVVIIFHTVCIVCNTKDLSLLKLYRLMEFTVGNKNQLSKCEY